MKIPHSIDSRLSTRHLTVLIALMSGFLIAHSLPAQSATLSLELARTRGYGGLNGDIQGVFTLKAVGPPNLARVEFYLDAAKIGEANRTPFTLQFATDDYPKGEHILSAKGATASGAQLASQTLTTRFMAAADGSRNVLTIVVPILVIVFGAIVLAAILPLLSGRKARALSPGTLRHYPLGGGICPKCGKPVGFRLFGLNLLGGKFECCPSCGKWSLIRYSSIDKLRAAEQAAGAGGQAQVAVGSGAEELKGELEESKYQDV